MKQAIATLLGRHVAAKRINRGFGQVELAEMVGVSRQAIWFIEHGKQTPRWATLYLIAESLRCEVADLLPSRGAVRRAQKL